MPCLATHGRSGILEWLVLKAGHGKSDGEAVLDQPHSIGGYEMGHGAALPYVPVQPEPAIHRVDHPLFAKLELAIRRIVAEGFTGGRFVAH